MSAMDDELALLRAEVESLRAKVRLLEEANQALEAFGYSVAHDLRAPLRTVHGFARALDEDYAHVLDDAGRDCLRRIMAGSARMDILIRDLLAYSRLSRMELEPDAVDLSAIVEEAVAQYRDAIAAAGGSVTVTSPLPTVKGHRSVVLQMVDNLLSNAVKFVPPGGRPIIAIHGDVRDGSGRLWVSDRGIGIEPANHERIFAVFERLHSVEEYPGTGIGLAIVKKGTERLGGTVGVESELGRGSRFWLSLPLT
jgi:signal transduction histidine kinase